MDRNEDRYWYDKGYADASKDKRKDSKIPKIIGYVCVSALLAVDQYWILAFVFFWALFELQEWWDLRKWHESDPPERWDS